MEKTFKITDKPISKTALNPEHILQIGLGFWASKTLLSAIKFNLFTILAESPLLSGREIQKKLNLHERSYLDFLDALVSLNFLRREGRGPDAMYSNTADTELFLDRKKPSYVGGILEMANNRLYNYWGNLEEALQTGMPQNETLEHPDKNPFEELYADPQRMKEFLLAMAGIQLGAFGAFVALFDFSNRKTLCDAGGAIGALCVQVAKQHSHIKCISYDMPHVEATAKAFVKEQGMEGRVDVVSGNFFESIPKADVVVMGNILHDWSDEEKMQLIKNAYRALPEGGVLVCIENLIDDDRRKNTFGILMSLNMLIETKAGRDFTFEEFKKWTKEAGFKKFDFIPLAGPSGAALAYK